MNNFNKRIKKLIEDKPASFQGPSHYTPKQRVLWNNLMNKPTMVNGKPVWKTKDQATEEVDNDTKESNSSTETTS